MAKSGEGTGCPLPSEGLFLFQAALPGLQCGSGSGVTNAFPQWWHHPSPARVTQTRSDGCPPLPTEKTLLMGKPPAGGASPQNAGGSAPLPPSEVFQLLPLRTRYFQDYHEA